MATKRKLVELKPEDGVVVRYEARIRSGKGSYHIGVDAETGEQLHFFGDTSYDVDEATATLLRATDAFDLVPHYFKDEDESEDEKKSEDESPGEDEKQA